MWTFFCRKFIRLIKWVISAMIGVFLISINLFYINDFTNIAKINAEDKNLDTESQSTIHLSIKEDFPNTSQITTLKNDDISYNVLKINYTYVTEKLNKIAMYSESINKPPAFRRVL